MYRRGNDRRRGRGRLPLRPFDNIGFNRHPARYSAPSSSSSARSFPPRGQKPNSPIFSHDHSESDAGNIRTAPSQPRTASTPQSNHSTGHWSCGCEDDYGHTSSCENSPCRELYGTPTYIPAGRSNPSTQRDFSPSPTPFDSARPVLGSFTRSSSPVYSPRSPTDYPRHAAHYFEAPSPPPAVPDFEREEIRYSPREPEPEYGYESMDEDDRRSYYRTRSLVDRMDTPEARRARGLPTDMRRRPGPNWPPRYDGASDVEEGRDGAGGGGSDGEPSPSPSYGRPGAREDGESVSSRGLESHAEVGGRAWSGSDGASDVEEQGDLAGGRGSDGELSPSPSYGCPEAREDEESVSSRGLEGDAEVGERAWSPFKAGSYRDAEKKSLGEDVGFGTDGAEEGIGHDVDVSEHRPDMGPASSESSGLGIEPMPQFEGDGSTMTDATNSSLGGETAAHPSKPTPTSDNPLQTIVPGKETDAHPLRSTTDSSSPQLHLWSSGTTDAQRTESDTKTIVHGTCPEGETDSQSSRPMTKSTAQVEDVSPSDETHPQPAKPTFSTPYALHAATLHHTERLRLYPYHLRLRDGPYTLAISPAVSPSPTAPSSNTSPSSPGDITLTYLSASASATSAHRPLGNIHWLALKLHQTPTYVRRQILLDHRDEGRDEVELMSALRFERRPSENEAGKKAGKKAAGKEEAAELRYTSFRREPHLGQPTPAQADALAYQRFCSELPPESNGD